MTSLVRLGLRIPKDTNHNLQKAAEGLYMSKNTLAIHIFDKWLKESGYGVRHTKNQEKYKPM